MQVVCHSCSEGSSRGQPRNRPLPQKKQGVSEGFHPIVEGFVAKSAVVKVQNGRLGFKMVSAALYLRYLLVRCLNVSGKPPRAA